ncbi:septum site-determining protein MinC [Candidatus Formimonas warabiya]|uniref:Probable septum site-determining protein MinC n=1 Tax=Formimonas warabiya TaxID=1761012 RepID=A0A3G1KPC8_FORW1|nr:septum site-determining protein MinC [Candidatus Formimonas warabiya]ATW24323.1 septum site-determining protein MinC [Candidatus Formimonas warabiya]
MSKELINIKGTRNGLVFYFNTKEGSFKEIQDILKEKFQESKGFFSDAKFIISPDNDLDEQQVKIIEEIILSNGLIKGQENKGTSHKGAPAPSFQVNDQTEYFTAVDNAVLISRSLRSGQKIYINGHAVIRGDVNPGAQVIATGSIVVMGTFRGLAHAGVHGDETAFVMAYRLRPTQIGIADKLSRSPENKEEAGYPEIAFVMDNHIVVEPFHTSRRKAVNL